MARISARLVVLAWLCAGCSGEPSLSPIVRQAGACRGNFCQGHECLPVRLPDGAACLDPQHPDERGSCLAGECGPA